MKTIYLFVSLLYTYGAFAQTDTLRLSLPQAQQQFTNRNLLLLAQRYNIEAAKAQIIQAGLLPNPNVAIKQSLMTQSVPVGDMNVGPLGQHSLDFQQLILLAGKRNKNIRLAQINAELSEYSFYDLLRTLTYSLNQNFYDLAFQLHTLEVYQQEIQTISKLVTAYKELYKNGNAPLKDVARLESFQFNLEGDKNNLELAIAQNQGELRTLLGIGSNQYIVPVVAAATLDSLNLKSVTIPDLLKTAQDNRPDLKLQEGSIRLASANLALQKALKVPDLTLGYSYDKAGDYTPHYHALTLQMDLPFFNKNQGNILSAKAQVDANQKTYEQTQLSVDNEILLAYNQAVKTEQLYRGFDQSFVPIFNQLIQGVVEGYRKNTISLVEFMDFFDSYKQNIEQYNRLQNNRAQAYLRLNYVLGKALFNL
ncbi:MAG: TolC family protein [Spirosomataceae bacterium]